MPEPEAGHETKRVRSLMLPAKRGRVLTRRSKKDSEVCQEALRYHGCLGSIVECGTMEICLA
jgi:hypothetical protein